MQASDWLSQQTYDRLAINAEPVLCSNTLVNFNAQFYFVEGPGFFLPNSFILCKNTLNEPNFIEIGDMFGKEVVKLITELDMHEDIRPFNEQVMRQVFEEMQTLYKANLMDSNAIQNERNNALLPSVHFRHTALLRNKRCILAYLYHRIRRLRQMRWELGSILPTEITANLLNAEMQWFQNYNKSLATYMRSIGDDHGLNLTVNMSPPKTLYVEVKCLSDFGKLELDDGEIITLKKNTYHLLPRAICEPLIRQGILEHHNA